MKDILPEEMVIKAEPGEPVVDTIKLGTIGEVVSFQIIPATYDEYNQETKELVHAEYDDLISVSFTFEADAEKSETAYMVGNMRVLIDRVAPGVNRINPAALITDSFYCLSIFEGHARYTRNIVTLLLLSVLFIGLGILKTRRSRYASI